MAFYFSSDTKAFYDTDVFPVASLPANKVEVAEADYQDLLSKQNSGYVILSDVSGNPYAVAQDESTATDINHAASVATTIALGHVKIGNTMQAANDGTLDLKDGAVTTAKIVDANVTADKLAANAVTTAKIADANVTTAKIADANVTTWKLANNAVTTAKIADANVTADKLAANAVTTAKIADGNVTTAKIADANVTTGKLANNAVTTAKIADANVTTGKLADRAVTEAKLEAVKELLADETTITLTEGNNNFTLSVKNGAITREKLNANLAPAVLPFKDSNDADLNGTNWSHTWGSDFDKQFIGNIGSHAFGRIVDFTFQARYIIPQGTVSSVQEFQLIVWHGTGSITSDKIYETRTVRIYSDEANAVRERFTFTTTDSDNIKINILPVLGANRLALENMQLKGFVF